MTRRRILIRLATLASLSLPMLTACADRAREITLSQRGALQTTAVTDPADGGTSDPSSPSDTNCSFSVSSPHDLRMTVSQRLNVFASASGSCTTNDITWTAAPSDVVTLTKKTTGVEVYAKKAASKVTITGTIGSTSRAFEMQILNARIEVYPATVTLTVNGTQQLRFRAYDHTGWELGTVYPDRVWTITSTNSAVAAINTSTGVVTGKSIGTAQIVASMAGGTGTSTITVVDPVATVTVSPNPASVNRGETTQLTATLRSANGTVLTGRAVTWTSDNPSIATVSSSGVVTGVAAGSTTIRATSEGKTGTTALTVSIPTQCLDCEGGEFPDEPIVP